jgi:hypothetical protein
MPYRYALVFVQETGGRQRKRDGERGFGLLRLSHQIMGSQGPVRERNEAKVARL